MSTSSRLNTIALDLVEFGETLSAKQRKAIACRVAEWACRTVTALTFLGEDRIRLLLDIDRSATQDEHQRIADDISDLDDKYFTAVEKNDGLDNVGNAMLWFCKARAAASVLYALDASTMQNFCEALYEAQAATNDLSGLKALCKQTRNP